MWYIQDEVPQCMLFADDIILIDESIWSANSVMPSMRQACFRVQNRVVHTDVFHVLFIRVLQKDLH